MTRRATTRGAQLLATRANGAEVELDLGAVDVRADQGIERIRPPFERIGHQVVHHRQLVLRRPEREGGELRHVLLLHAEADARARHEQEEGFLERVEPVHVRERAVEHAGVVRFDGPAAELQRAHGGQDRATLQRCLRFRHERAHGASTETGHRQVHAVSEVVAVHVHHARERFGRRFAAPQIFPVARIAREENVVLQAVLGVHVDAVLGARGAIQHVALGDVPMTARGDHHFDDVLDLFDRGDMILGPTLDGVHHQLRDRADIGEVGEAQAEAVRGVVVKRVRRIVVTRGVERQGDRACDALGIPRGRAPVALHDLHDRLDPGGVVAGSDLGTAGGDGRGQVCLLRVNQRLNAHPRGPTLPPRRTGQAAKRTPCHEQQGVQRSRRPTVEGHTAIPGVPSLEGARGLRQMVGLLARDSSSGAAFPRTPT